MAEIGRRKLIGGLLATAGGLLLPYEPKRVYSFARPDFVVQLVGVDEFTAAIRALTADLRKYGVFLSPPELREALRHVPAIKFEVLGPRQPDGFIEILAHRPATEIKVDFGFADS